MADILPGRLGFVFLVSILDAVLLSFAGLLWYRHAVRGLTRSVNGAAAPVAFASLLAPRGVLGAGTRVDFALGEASKLPPESRVTTRSARSRRLFVAYGLGAALHAAVITAFDVVAAPPPSPVAVLAKWWVYTWPLLPTLFAIGALGPRARLGVALSHVGFGALALMLFTVARQLTFGALDLAPLTNVYWMIVTAVFTAWAPFLLVWLTGWRRVRAVTPVALAATLVFGFGLMSSWDALLFAMDRQSSRAVLLGLTGATSAEVALHLPFLLLSLPLGWIAWRLLRGLANQFHRKQFSDVQLVVDCWWVIVTAEQVAVVLSSSYGAWSLAIGFFALGAYRGAVALALASAHPAPLARGRRLLLLRVFGYQRRTEELFDRVAQRWRFYGPVQLIGGVDLAARTIDPGDILAFLGGRLEEQCVVSESEVPRRIDDLDFARDPDGRFRVNEVYCRTDTWKATLRALLDVTDLVLMDLRTFSRQNAGCQFELEQLVRRLPTDRVVLVCDRTTDLDYLRLVLGGAWTAAERDDQTRGEPRFVTAHVEHQSSRELGGLFETLLVMGAAGDREGGPRTLVASA